MNILTACQDPGGCNSIAPVAAALAARGERVGGTIADPDIVLLGTSGGPSIEKEATLRWRGVVPTVAVLDFWSNYWQRFSGPDGKDFRYLPDRVCVMDDIARDEMLAEGFPPECLVVTGNPHFDHFADGVTREGEDPRRILFISQPMRADMQIPGLARAQSDEYTILDSLLAALPPEHSLSIRLHPRDVRDKYDRYLDNRVSVAQEATLEEALSHSGLVIGPATPVLMQAAAAGKKALCYEPVLTGPDTLVSNRAGVTVRIDSPQALQSALAAYAAGEWPFKTRPMREVWPSGATGRVVDVVQSLLK